MILHYLKQETVKRKSILLATIGLIIGLTLQSVCLPDSFHHSVKVDGSAIRLEWEDDCPLSKRLFWNSSTGETDSCEVLNSVNSLVPNKKPRLASDVSFTPVLGNPEDQRHVFASLSDYSLSTGKSITHQTSLYALKTALLFYD